MIREGYARLSMPLADLVFQFCQRQVAEEKKIAKAKLCGVFGRGSRFTHC